VERQSDSSGLLRTPEAAPADPRPPIGGVGIARELTTILREAIWSSRLEPGQRLNELHLAAEFGVSRPPLREAIRTLEAEGLVSSVPRRGAFVRVLSARDVREIFTVRYGLESLAGELIVGREDAPAIADRLHRQLDALEAQSGAADLAAVIQADLAFHREMVAAAENLRLLRTWDHAAGEVRLAFTLVDASFFEVAYFEDTHRGLVEALRVRDEERMRGLFVRLRGVTESLERKWDALARTDQ
jgi:DNA-binding GntR family transcriptional regulator